jgi:26S proteasome regulatory subunit T5
MASLEDKSLWEGENDEQDGIDQEILRLSPEEITNRTRLLQNDIKVRRAKYYACLKTCLTSLSNNE